MSNPFYNSFTSAPPNKSTRLYVPTIKTQTEPKKEEVKEMDLKELKAFRELSTEDKYVYIMDKANSNATEAIKLLVLWVKEIDSKKQ